MLQRFKQHTRQQPFHYSQTIPVNALPIPHFQPSCEKVQKWMDSPAKIKLLVGGNQSGKTTTGVGIVVERGRQIPNGLSWLAALDFEMGHVLYKKMLEYLAPHEIKQTIWASRGKEIPHSIIHHNGHRFVMKSMAAGYSKFEADRVDGTILLDEECPEKKILTSCIARTTFTDAPILMTFTPLKGKTWVHKDYFQSESPDIYSETISLYDNIYLPPDKRDKIIALYSEEEQEYRVFGKWGVLEGRILKDFAEKTHVLPFDEKLLRPERLRIIMRSLDFGRTLACTWIGLAPNDDAYIIADLKREEMTLEDFAHEMDVIEKDLGIENRIDDTVTDHAFQERFELERYGIFCTPADKSWALGKSIMQRRCKLHNGKPALYALDTCVDTVEELLDYQYKPTRKGQEPTGEPWKFNDHLTDTVRYNLVELDEYCRNPFGVSASEIIQSSMPSVIQ